MSTAPQPSSPPPGRDRVERARITRFHTWAADRHGAPARTGDPHTDYHALHAWSVDHPGPFWRALARWTGAGLTPYRTELADDTMPGAVWFPGARLNYAARALRPAAERPDDIALFAVDETHEVATTTWAGLRDQVASVAARLRDLGVTPGDRVSGYLPNIPQAVVALLATAAVGAVWTSCAPDFGPRAVLARFQQVEPVVLFTVDGYTYGGKRHDRTATVAALRRELPALRAVVHVPLLGTPAPDGALTWDDIVAVPARPAYADVPFDHPLWVLYSSGTTGLPKAIVHSQGGILLEHLKQTCLHLDLGPGDRFFWYTSTGWMMWNFLVGGLLAGAALVLYDGAPAHPATGAQWRIAELTRATVLGTSAAYVMACRKAGLTPGTTYDLSATTCVATTGSPLPPDGFRWVYEAVRPDIWLASISGGTDVCSCFAGGVPTLPVHIGELQAPCLATALEAWDPSGRPVTGEVGELVVTRPLPSMPTRFWNDPDGSRYHDSYFAAYPGVWRHGDWITVTPSGGVVIHGRSDATLNRQGVRMGSADIYEVVERLPEIRESLVIGVEEPDGGYWMPLFVRLADGAVLDDPLRDRLRTALRTSLSPRHVPDEIIEVPGFPHTLTGKRLEVPVKRLLQGTPLTRAVNPDSVDDLTLLTFYADLAATRAAS